MQFKQYPSYKKSGVEWLGDVPEHWQIVRTKDIFNHRKEEALEDDEIVTAFRDGQVTLRKNRRTDGFTNSIKEHGYQHINNGDLVIHEMDAFAGAIGVSDSSGKSTPVYTVCYAKNENINHHFYSHFFRTMAKTGFINSLAKGIRVRSTEFRWNESRNVYLVEPPKSDQQKIVAFLDTETTRIDNLIAKQEKLIELLEEQRKSIISHAVTKGLNPNAPMKDSGVEWLGEVPEHWIISRVKFNFRNLDSKRIPLTSEERSYRQGVYPYYGASGIIDYVNSFIFEEDLVLFSEDGANLAYRSMPIAFVAKGKYWVNNHAHILKPFDNLTAYWACVLESVDVNLSITGATQPKITAENLGNICISFPPSFEERLSINNYILEESLKIDTLILKQNQLIEKLKEYRASIISHAVTGKIDVREFVA
ncbi:restriction endonuclease subunit S [Acinetobacter junii]|uniref:restriction endonuclease subunit S n=1 Tax=Acinetobacter junii TaxID=40215 RepID=UPI0024499BAF|nr:restriction endonuclease subunit S [Acinetobacter junii]MDH1859814.1 restriction endonuclease subunit S [Acinetobacter junii]